jgi:hypothetical protein
MMADPIDDAIAAAQKAAFQSVPATGGKVTPIRSGISSIPDGPVCQPVDAFLADGDAPSWVVGGIIQTNYLYALTAPTNHGKTAVSLVMALCVAAGRPFAGRQTMAGKVLILCGENQDGFRLRMLATMDSLGITMNDVRGRMFVLPQSTGLAYLLEQIKKDADTMGDLTFVLVDTSVSFFTGDNENDNQQAYAHARDLRELSLLPGKPAVVVNCHPASGAGKDLTRESCVPRGGSAFLNEIDTNLTVWAEGECAEFHWMRKKRGPDFSPILFEYRAINVQSHDQAVPTVVAEHIDEHREKEIRTHKREHEARLMSAMYHNQNGTLREWAFESGFTIKTGKYAGQPHMSMTARTLERLKEYKLAERSRRDGWVLTRLGKEEAKDIG